MVSSGMMVVTKEHIGLHTNYLSDQSCPECNREIISALDQPKEIIYGTREFVLAGPHTARSICLRNFARFIGAKMEKRVIDYQLRLPSESPHQSPLHPTNTGAAGLKGEAVREVNLSDGENPLTPEHPHSPLAQWRQAPHLRRRIRHP